MTAAFGAFTGGTVNAAGCFLIAVRAKPSRLTGCAMPVAFGAFTGGSMTAADHFLIAVQARPSRLAGGALTVTALAFVANAVCAAARLAGFAKLPIGAGVIHEATHREKGILTNIEGPQVMLAVPQIEFSDLMTTEEGSLRRGPEDGL